MPRRTRPLYLRPPRTTPCGWLAILEGWAQLVAVAVLAWWAVLACGALALGVFYLVRGLTAAS